MDVEVCAFGFLVDFESAESFLQLYKLLPAQAGAGTKILEKHRRDQKNALLDVMHAGRPIEIGRASCRERVEVSEESAALNRRTARYTTQHGKGEQRGR